MSIILPHIGEGGVIYEILASIRKAIKTHGRYLRFKSAKLSIFPFRIKPRIILMIKKQTINIGYSL